jgi:hypothetical protein
MCPRSHRCIQNDIAGARTTRSKEISPILGQNTTTFTVIEIAWDSDNIVARLARVGPRLPAF